MRLNPGDTFPDFTVNTHKRSAVQLHDLFGKKTVLWVIRYIGCTVCRYDVHVLAENFDHIADKGVTLLVVMQSDQEHVQKELKDIELPFEIVCDNTLEIYKTLEINPAASREELAGNDIEKLKAKGARARELGFSHGDYEGDEMQLPALFIIDENGTVETAHYGTSIMDMPTVDQLVEML